MNRYALPFSVVGIIMLAACGGGTNSGGYSPAIQSAMSQPATSEQSVVFRVTGPKVVRVGFKHAAATDPTYGPIAFYAPDKLETDVITVKAGSKIQFLNDDSTRHTASGLGMNGGFPSSYDNTSGTKQVGTMIDGSLTWSTGSLNPNQKSQIFTVGAKGAYYFGCYFHYRVTPSMRDVIVAN